MSGGLAACQAATSEEGRGLDERQRLVARHRAARALRGALAAIRVGPPPDAADGGSGRRCRGERRRGGLWPAAAAPAPAGRRPAKPRRGSEARRKPPKPAAEPRSLELPRRRRACRPPRPLHRPRPLLPSPPRPPSRQLPRSAIPGWRGHLPHQHRTRAAPLRLQLRPLRRRRPGSAGRARSVRPGAQGQSPTWPRSGSRTPTARSGPSRSARTPSGATAIRSRPRTSSGRSSGSSIRQRRRRTPASSTT